MFFTFPLVLGVEDLRLSGSYRDDRGVAWINRINPLVTGTCNNIVSCLAKDDDGMTEYAIASVGRYGDGVGDELFLDLLHIPKGRFPDDAGEFRMGKGDRRADRQGRRHDYQMTMKVAMKKAVMIGESESLMNTKSLDERLVFRVVSDDCEGKKTDIFD